MKPIDTTFKDAFCATYKCHPEDYTRKMLLRSFKWHAVWIARILLAVDSPSIRPAIEAINLLEQAQDTRDVISILNDYRYQLRKPPISTWVRSLNIRLSGSRVLNLFEQVKQKSALRAQTVSSPAEGSVYKTDDAIKSGTFHRPIAAQI